MVISVKSFNEEIKKKKFKGDQTKITKNSHSLKDKEILKTS